MKVYSLIRVARYVEFQMEVKCRTFKNLDNAKKAMQEDLEETKRDWGDKFEIEEDDTCCSIYQNYFDGENRVDLKIYENEVE